MWNLLLFQTIIYWLPALPIALHVQNMQLMFNEFLLLGIIPGTNIAITFNWIAYLFWALFFYWLITKLSFSQLEKYKNYKKSNHIKQISL